MDLRDAPAVAHFKVLGQIFSVHSYIHKAIRVFMKISEAFSLLGAMAAASLKFPASDNECSMYIQSPAEFKNEGLGKQSVHSSQALRKAIVR